MKYILFLIINITFVPFLIGQEWQTDLTMAKKQAEAKGQKIILVFQGSDWCAPCIKLDKEIWSTEEFKTYAKKNYVMLQADFPRRKANRLTDEQQEKNNQLAEKYNHRGFFPHVVVLDAKGKVLGQTGYKQVSPSEYIKIIDSF